MTTRSLYHRILGEKLAALPQPMRGWHQSPLERSAAGTLLVTRGRTWLSHLAANIGRMPKSEERVSVVLEVQPIGERERWVRNFGEQQLVSIQWMENGLLMEQFTSSRLRLAVEVVPGNNGLEFVLRRSYLGPIPIPRWLAPRVTTTAVAAEQGWQLLVRVELPLVGLLIEYCGELQCRW
jgi:hypothetical protein